MTDHFNLIEHACPERILEALQSPLITSDHANRLGMYYRLAKMHHGNIPITYRRKKKGELVTGRYHPDGKFLSGVYQWRAIRATLYADTETDIDAKSCHPTILAYLAKNNGLQCAYLEQYIADRAAFIDDLDITQADLDKFNAEEHADYSLKDMGKFVFTSSMYGSGVNTIKKKLHMDRSPIVDGSDADHLIKEVKAIAKTLTMFSKYRHYKDNLPKRDQHPGKVLSYIVTDIETEVVVQLMEHFKQAGIAPTIYMYDGFQVASQDHAKIDGLLAQFRNPYGLKFIRKPFSKPLDKLTNTKAARTPFQIENLLNSLTQLVGLTDQHCAQLFLDKHLGLDLEKSNGGSVIYLPKRGVWQDGSVESLLMYEDISTTDGEKITPHYVQNATGFDHVKKYLKPMVKDLPNTEIIAELNYRTIGKLFFNNGWLDIRNGQTGVVSSPREIAFWKINRDMPDWSQYSWEHPDVRELMERGLNIFEPEQLKAVLWAVARAAAGHVQDKNLYLIPGLRDSGKGVLCALMENALGIFPHGICTHISIPMHKDIETGDAKSRSWFLASRMHLARIALSNELIGKSDRKVDGNTIKSLASGGDKIKARLNHQDERDEANNCTCFFFFNPPSYGGLPRFEPQDALQKCTLFEMPFCFTTDQDKLDSSPIYKQADPDIKSWIFKNTAIADAFVWVLMQHYRDRPLETKDLPEDFRQDNQEKDEIANNHPMAIFSRNFILDPDGDCPAQEFREIMGLSALKATSWLKKNLKGKLESYTTITVRCESGCYKAYRGFKRR